tara:strand:+ start:2947 stop:3171 length:225 start_codon:yes stop_codon:yes gene_type:complete
MMLANGSELSTADVCVPAGEGDAKGFPSSEDREEAEAGGKAAPEADPEAGEANENGSFAIVEELVFAPVPLAAD